jgi:hypothetical protein
MRHINTIVACALLCSCSSVKKSITRVKESARVDSSGTKQSSYEKVTEVIEKATAPGYTKPDSAGVTWFEPAGDTAERSQTVQSGPLTLHVTSKPRRDGAGRDISVKATKAPEAVDVPVDRHTRITEKGNGSESREVHRQEDKKDVKKDVDRKPQLLSWIGSAAVLLFIILLLIGLIKKYVR